MALQWCHNERDGVSNHQRLNCLLKRLFRRRSKKISKLRITGLCAGNSPVTGEFPTQRASNAEIFPSDDVIMGLKFHYVSKVAPDGDLPRQWLFHYDDVIMSAIASQITSLTVVYATVYWGADQSKHQSSGEFPAQRASYAENVSIWWRHHVNSEK